MDNASGIAVLLQIARDLSRKKAPRRSIVFAAVTAEELGLLGSRAYVADAQARGQRIVANLNTDMFMPLYPMKQVVVFGLEESDLADDARAIARGARHRGADGSAAAAQSIHPQRSVQLHSRRAFPRSRPRSALSRIHRRRRSTASGSPSVITACRIRPISPWIWPPSATYEEFIKRLARARREPQDSAALVRQQRVRAVGNPLRSCRLNAGTEFSPPRIRGRRRPATRRSPRPAPAAG